MGCHPQKIGCMKDFFISYNKADKHWAEWIAWILEESGYSVVIQAWDFRPGGNFVLEMQQAASETDKTIAILSQDYLDTEYTQPEWAAAFTRDPRGKNRSLIPVRVDDCTLEGLHSSLINIDLVGLSEEGARRAILDGVKERAKPDEAPGFPGDRQSQTPATERVAPHPVGFPGGSTSSSSTQGLSVEIPWNVPQGVPFFTGREDILDKLHEALLKGNTAVLAQRQAISGLGGIGKTQTAIAYATRYRHQYNAVLWAVAESRESLISDFVAIASVLNLPEKNIQDQNFVVAAVKRWLEANAGWLLILDNADEPNTVEEFMPGGSNGHVLLTSRAQVFDSIGILNPIEMEEMTAEDAKEFLLRRTGRSDLDTDEDTAVEQLALELDYLPLALEQAGAYIKELRSSFQDYLASYRKRGIELLEKGVLTGKDRKSVRTTWSLNFQQVEETSKAAGDVLQVSAFLSPDKIPNELISEGAINLGPELSSALTDVASDPLIFDELLKPLIQYSLLHRDRKSKTYDIHRLVQAVLKEGMNDDVKRLWIERVINAVARVLPEVDLNDLSTWAQIERILPHAQVCADLMQRWNIVSIEGAQLLNNLGRYLHLRARLGEAEVLYNRSLTIRQCLLDANHWEIASSLHNLGWLYFDQGKYTDAEPLFLRSLAIWERAFDSQSTNIATSLYFLARLYIEMDRYTEADSFIARSLEIREEILGDNHVDVVDVYVVKAELYRHLREDIEAEKLLTHALKIAEEEMGKEHYTIGSIIGNLGGIYRHRGNLNKAKELNLKALKIYEQAFGENYPIVATCLNNLGITYVEMGRHSEAEPLFLRALEIREIVLGHEHPEVAVSLDTLGWLRSAQGKYAEAEGFYNKALHLAETVLGPETLLVASTLTHLATLYYRWHKPHKGEPLARRALLIRRKILGSDHPLVAEVMLTLAQLLENMNRKGEAQKIESHALKIQSKNRRKSKKRK
jgi:tetratricopeptide (TPR) repeat protein